MATTTATATPSDPSKAALINQKKWSKTLLDAGYTAFPSIVLEHQRDLGLDAVDVNILVYLSTFWWTADAKPHPSKSTIANALGMHPRTVQRHVAELQKRGLLRREERRLKGEGSKTNLYHFDGLIKAAKPFAEAKAKEIAAKVAKKKMGGAKPALTLVKK